MDVDFNNARKQAIADYERLAKRLNAHIEKDSTWHDGPHVIIPVRELDKVMEDLRQSIGLIAMVHDGDNPEFKDVFSEVFPEDKYKHGPCMTVFNPEEDGE